MEDIDSLSVLDLWLQACETCLRVADFATLARLVKQPPNGEGSAHALFYSGRMAIGVADFEGAVGFLRQANYAAEAVGQHDLKQRTLVWIAYAESQRGNYDYARKLADELKLTVGEREPIYAQIFFVRGLIAAEQETLPEAQRWMEQARETAIVNQDTWMEARCCANLAVIYNHQGLLDRGSSMIRRVERLNTSAERPSNQQQLIQIRNIQVHNLRMRGELTRALALAEPLPEIGNDGSKLFAGYLALTSAMVATDLGDFVRAERLWVYAQRVLNDVDDDDRTQAELFWEHAWLRARQGDLEAAYVESQKALELIHDRMETECFHGYVVAAIINIRRNDRGSIGAALRQARDRFRTVGHYVGLASVLLHLAAFYLQDKRIEPGRAALAEALTLLSQHQIYGVYYWDPPVIAMLCREAMLEAVWGDQAEVLAAQFFAINQAQVAERFEIEGGPVGMWGDFAASLAAKRLADSHWQVFAPLLSDVRPQVRRRALLVFAASSDPQAQMRIEQLEAHTDREGLFVSLDQPNILPVVQVFSFGRLEILLGGRPLHLQRASTPKGLILFAALLLAGDLGMNSNELEILLWPGSSLKSRKSALHTTISNLRSELRQVLGNERGNAAIRSFNHRYYLKIGAEELWWDWSELQHLAAQQPFSPGLLEQAERLYRDEFMPPLTLYVPSEELSLLVQDQFERIAGTLSNWVVEHEMRAAEWMEELRSKCFGNEH